MAIIPKNISILNVKGLIIILLFCISANLNAQIAIVVHKDNPLDEISIDDLRKIYKGEMNFFPNSKLKILTCESHTIKDAFYKKIYNWTVLKFKKHWMKLIFSGENLRAPKTFKNEFELINFMKTNIDAIVYMKYTDVDPDLKIIQIDGKSPNHPDYFLKFE